MTKRTLLVADDSRTVQRIVEMACAQEDFQVVSVADGELAIAQIEAHHPDVVLADIGMPRRSGYDVAAFVKGRPDLAHIPVLLMAGMFDAADDSKAKSFGCAEVLIKPLKPQHVVERVRHWLDSPPASISAGVSGPAVQATNVATTAEAGTTGDVTEDYFSRLDAAFKSLERPFVERHGVDPAGAGSVDAGSVRGEAVPTLQELLHRLPHETRTRLTPPPPSPGNAVPAADSAWLDAIANRLLDELAKREDVLDEIARRVALRQRPDDRR